MPTNLLLLLATIIVWITSSFLAGNSSIEVLIKLNLDKTRLDITLLKVKEIIW